jgi:hypothetical protein
MPMSSATDLDTHTTLASTMTVSLQTYSPGTLNQPTTTTGGATGNGSGVQPGGVTPVPVTPGPPAATISPLILLGTNYPNGPQGTAGTSCNPVLLNLGGGSILNVANGAGDIAVNANCDNAVVLQPGATPRLRGARGPGHGKTKPVIQSATTAINGNTMDVNVVDPLATLPTPTAPTGLTTATQLSCSLNSGVFTLQPGSYPNGVYGLGSTLKTSPCGNFSTPRKAYYNFTPGIYQFGNAGVSGGLVNVEGSTTVTFQATAGTATEVYFADGFEAGQTSTVTFGNGLYLLNNVSAPAATCSAKPNTPLNWWKAFGPSFLNSIASCNAGPGCKGTGATYGTQGAFSVFGNANIATSIGGALFYVMGNNGGFNIATAGSVYLQGLGTWNGQNYQGLSLWDGNVSATSQVLLASVTKKAMVVGGVYVPYQQVVIGQQGTLTAKYMDLQSLSFLGYGTLNIG